MHFNHWRTLPCILFLVLFLAGCTQGVKEYWKTTKRYYYGYINTPAELDLDVDEIPAGAEVIAIAMPAIDAELMRFERALFALDRDPDGAWMQQFTGRHSWISGMAIIDLEGNAVNRWPDSSLKNLDFKPLVEIMPEKTTRLLRTYAQDTPLGPEVYVAVPILEAGSTARYFVAHFDPRDLMSRAPYSSEFMVVAPDVLLWPGKYQAGATPVVNEDWSRSIRRSANGTVRNEAGEFFWVGRYLGTMPLAFAAPESGEFPEVEGQMAPYSSGGFRGTLPPAGAWGSEAEAGERVILMEAAPPPPDYFGGSGLRESTVGDGVMEEPAEGIEQPQSTGKTEIAPPPPDMRHYQDGPDAGDEVGGPGEN